MCPRGSPLYSFSLGDSPGDSPPVTKGFSSPTGSFSRAQTSPPSISHSLSTLVRDIHSLELSRGRELSEFGCRVSVARARARARSSARARPLTPTALCPLEHSPREDISLRPWATRAHGPRHRWLRRQPRRGDGRLFSVTPWCRAGVISKHTPPLFRNALHTCRFQS